ncbi:MAG: SLAC1 family transporter, partial [Nocardioides sp.]
LWIVLGPLGQSVTAAHTLTVAGVGPAWWGLGYGLPVWGAALAWAAYAGRATWRAVRAGLPFAMSWWSFTFPLGTLVTGTSALAAATGARPFTLAAPLLYAALVAVWGAVADRTLGHVRAEVRGLTRS